MSLRKNMGQFGVALLCSVFPFHAIHAGDCKEHLVMTDPVTMTATVNMDPYNRKDNNDVSLWNREKEVYMEQSTQGSQLFEHVPEGTYIFTYKGAQCSVDVKLEVYIKALEDRITIALPCEDEPFSPVSFDVISNDIYTCKYAIRDLPVSEGNVTVELVDAPYFVHAAGAQVFVECPFDTAPGDYAFTYKLKDQLGRYSNETKGYITLTHTCPEKPLPKKGFEIAQLDVPELITPNGDGVNDGWVIPGLDTLGRFKIELYDRIGKMIWSSDDIMQPWDGTRDGHPLPSQDYWYIVYLFDADATFKGHITLIR